MIRNISAKFQFATILIQSIKSQRNVNCNAYKATFATHKSRKITAFTSAHSLSLCENIDPLQQGSTVKTKYHILQVIASYYKILGYHDNHIHQTLWLCILIIFDTKCALSTGRKLKWVTKYEFEYISWVNIVKTYDKYKCMHTLRWSLGICFGEKGFWHSSMLWN